MLRTPLFAILFHYPIISTGWLASTILGTRDSMASVVLNPVADFSPEELTASSVTPSQFYTDFPDYDCTVLESFTVSSAELRLIEISAIFRAQGGFESFRNVEGYALNFFSDPGLAVFSLTGDVASLHIVSGPGVSVTEVVEADPDHDYGLIRMSVEISLASEGTYWMGLSPISSLSATGQFVLVGRPVAEGGSPSYFANPGEGFGLGPLSPLDTTHAYALAAVPEPSSVGLVAAGAGSLLIRRRRTTATPATTD